MLTWQKIFSKIILVGLFVIPFVPLLVSSSLFFPYITGKAFIFRLLVEILLGLWLVLILFEPSARPKSSLLVWVAAALLGLAVLATIFGADPYRSFWSNFERMDGLISYLHLAGYFLLLIANLREEKLWRRWWLNVLLVSIIVFISALVEFSKIASGASARLSTSFGNPIYLAVFMLFSLFITAWFWFYAEKRWQKALLGALALAQFWTLYQTATRSALLGLVVGIFLMLVLVVWRAKNYPRIRYFAAGFFLLLVLLGGALWLARENQFVKNQPVLARLTSISLADATTRHRLINWQMALQGFAEKPLLGWGPENYVYVFNKYYDPKLYDAEPWFDRTHNIFLDWLVNAGLFGLLAYLGLYLVALFYLWRRRTVFAFHEQIIFTGLFAAYLFHNIFVFDNLTSYLLFFATLSYLHFRVTENSAPAIKKTKFSPISPWLIFPSIVIGLAAISTIYYVNFLPWQANRALIQALASSEPKTKLNLFQQAAAKKTFARVEVAEQLSVRTFQALKYLSADSVDLQAFVKETQIQLNQLIEKEPNNARYWILQGEFLAAINQIDQAIVALERARELSPRRQTIQIQLASLYEKKGQKERASQLAKAAFDLEPRDSEARKLYALFLIGRHEFAAAEELLATMPVTLDDQFFKAYADAGEYEKALEILQAKIKKDGTNASMQINLAVIYFRLGWRQQSIIELNQAIELEPKMKTQIEKWIALIRAGKDPSRE